VNVIFTGSAEDRHEQMLLAELELQALEES